MSATMEAQGHHGSRGPEGPLLASSIRARRISGRQSRAHFSLGRRHALQHGFELLLFTQVVTCAMDEEDRLLKLY